MHTATNSQLKPIEGLPQPVDGDIGLAYKVPKPLPKKSFALYVCGQPGSGKSNLWLQLLMSHPTKKSPKTCRYYYRYFDRVYLISGSLDTLPLEKLSLNENRVFNQYDDCTLSEIISGEHEDENNNNTLIILDDCIRDLSKSKDLCKAVLNRRHCTHNSEHEGQAGLALLITSQVYNWLPLGLRKNMSHVVLFRTENSREKSCIKDELMADLSDAEATQVMSLAWNDKHSFLLILSEMPTKERYYKNFDLIIL
jgi:hypothetical protein